MYVQIDRYQRALLSTTGYLLTLPLGCAFVGHVQIPCIVALIQVLFLPEEHSGIGQCFLLATSRLG